MAMVCHTTGVDQKTQWPMATVCGTTGECQALLWPMALVCSTMVAREEVLEVFIRTKSGRIFKSFSEYFPERNRYL
jgi:hypothetical protein